MRGLALVALGVAACTPDIVPGAYFCGPEQLCPEGQACNGTDNTCVDPSMVTAFACDPATLYEPDDTPGQGLEIKNLACVSAPDIIKGCLAAGDGQNWVRFQAPGNCAAVAIHATLSFPVAFEPLAMQLRDVDTNTQLAVDTPCSSTAIVAGDASRCLAQTLVDGASYALAVTPAGGGDCGGTCNYNRYGLTIQLVTP